MPEDFLALFAEAATAPDLAQLFDDEFGASLTTAAKAGNPGDEDFAGMASSHD